MPMIYRRAATIPSIQQLLAAMREVDSRSSSSEPIQHPAQPSTSSSSAAMTAARITSPGASACAMPPSSSAQPVEWRDASEATHRMRSQLVVQVDRMLRNHQPHDVLTQVPENTQWQSKTFQLAMKIERLMFMTAASREQYLNEQTLRSRVKILSRHLVRIRKQKNSHAPKAQVQAA